MSASATQPKSMGELYRTFITACHILHYHGVLDAYGHLSVRHPEKSNVFIMSRFIAPGTLSSPEDLIEYWIEDASPVDPSAKPGYSERCIHSEILKACPNMNAVIHSHAPSVVAFACSSVPLQPIYHMAGFLSEKVPVWDIAKHYEAGDKQNMLVSNTRLGKALAETFKPSAGTDGPTVVLMRGHGFSCAAETIQDCVMRAHYTQENAAIQASALSALAGSGSTTGLQYLSAGERAGSATMAKETCMRPWGLWCKEVEAQPLYVNKA